MPTSVVATDNDFIHLDSLEASPDFMDGNSMLTSGDPSLVMVTSNATMTESQSQVKEIISYQRFGKIDKTVFSNVKFKCHLCGFGCVIRDTLLKHFDESHPL